MSGRRVQPGREEPRHRPWTGAVLASALLGGLLIALLRLPAGDTPLPAIARRAMTDTLPAFKSTEPVSAVVYGFRAMDTFGETFLLLAAVVTVVLLTRTREPRGSFVGEHEAGEEEQREVGAEQGESRDEAVARTAEEEETSEVADGAPAFPDAEPIGTPAPERALGMTVVTRFAVRLTLPLLAVAGVYLVAQGYSPGGGFPAGGVVLGVVLLVHAAFGHPFVARAVRPTLTEAVELAGAVAIIALLVLGLPLAGTFAANWVPLGPVETLRSGGMMQVFSVSEFVEVGSGLVITVFAVMGIRHDWAGDEEEQR